MIKTIRALADELGASLNVSGEAEITGIAPLDQAKRGDISFLSSSRYEHELATTRATAVIVKPSQADIKSNAVLVLHEDPYRCFAQLTAIFNPEKPFQSGIHETAIVAASASIPASVTIGPRVVIGEQVVLGEHTVVEAGSVIGDHCSVGHHSRLHPNVTLYHSVKLGNEVNIHSGAIIGCDGFGYAPDPKGERKWHKIHQLGTVIIGDRVDVGSSTTIDRGALGDTVIEDDVIIDSQVHIGHNCKIGQGSALAGCVGLAGSSIIGKGCLLAGGVGIAGHLSICDGVQVTGMTMVTKSITQPGSYSAGTPMMMTNDWRKAAVRFSQLDKLNKRVKALEEQQP